MAIIQKNICQWIVSIGCLFHHKINCVCILQQKAVFSQLIDLIAIYHFCEFQISNAKIKVWCDIKTNWEICWCDGIWHEVHIHFMLLDTFAQMDRCKTKKTFFHEQSVDKRCSRNCIIPDNARWLIWVKLFRSIEIRPFTFIRNASASNWPTVFSKKVNLFTSEKKITFFVH